MPTVTSAERARGYALKDIELATARLERALEGLEALAIPSAWAEREILEDAIRAAKRATRAITAKLEG